MFSVICDKDIKPESIKTGEKLDLSNLPEAEVEKLNDYCDSLQTELDISLSTNILNLLK